MTEISSNVKKTNLFEAMKAEENQAVLRKLYLFMLIEGTIPILSFFLVRNYLSFWLGVSTKFRTVFAAGVSVVLLNFIIFAYIFLAFNEGEELTKKKKE